MLCSRAFGLQAVVVLLIGATVFVQAARAEEGLAPVASYEHLAGPMIEQYCFDCHSGDAPDAGLALHKMDGGEGFQRDREHWTKVLGRLQAGDMPPPDYDAPTLEERKQLIEWIEARLDDFDCSGPQDPGWITLRRLNRDQYKNTIRELLGVDFEPAKTFPPDELAYGFDNNADILSLTPILLEKYLAAAREISHEAIRTPESLTANSFQAPKDRWEGGQRDRADARELWTSGAIEFEHEVATPGRYVLRATVSASQAGDEPVRMAMLNASHPVHVVSVHATQDEQESFTTVLDLPEGKRRLGVAFLNDYSEGPDRDRNLFVHRLEVVGPVDAVMQAVPPAHREWFADAPTPEVWYDDQQWREVVRDTLMEFASRAYRRPAPEEEIDRLMALVDSRRLAGDTYERAMQVTLQAVLVSPRFLFIGNVDEPVRPPSGDAHGYAIDEYELASRLSYFLWSSMPDAQLLRLAGQGKLREQLASEVTRMLRDRRASEFTQNFPGQWLGVRQLSELQPDEGQFPNFDDALREAMIREAQMVFAEVVRNDLPITTLLNADFTYLNQRLAEHYGIEGVRGNFFRRVALSELSGLSGVRGGVITMAGVLTVTSNPDRTSPVKRGKWLLGELLGAEPPPPPPGIESLEEVVRKHDRKLSIREQIELHRADPSCAVCHVVMDPLGLALENYDAVGRWRDEDELGAIDASGELPTGEKINGASDLREILVARRDAFRACLAEKMLTYALGRGLEYYDECAVRQIAEQVAAQDDRMRSLILAIVESTPFQERRFERSVGEGH